MEQKDFRHISNGRIIPTESYSDQPYIVKTDNCAWLCVVTTGSGKEGESCQHIISMRSIDKGKTWKDTIDVEPADGVEASWAVLLKTPGGRIFCFYNHNTDNIRKIIADNPPYKDGYCSRVDSLGYYCFKFSDDHGKTWSERRYTVDVREMEIDRQNAYNGKLRFFWNVGKPFIYKDTAYVSLHKVGGFGEGFFTRSEGVLLKSENITTEKNPEKITWTTLPDGEAGLRTPENGGPIAEEHSYCVLSDGSFYCVYRTVDGHPVYAISRDQGHTWTKPDYLRFANGRIMKNPRAANFLWKCSNGKYIYWFHNHGGRFVNERMERDDGYYPYYYRNPVWLCGGIEKDTCEGKTIEWSQPEIAIYDDDLFIFISYPDFIEQDNRFYITETQKHIARIHEFNPSFMENMWNQFKRGEFTRDGLILDLPEDGSTIPERALMPKLPLFCSSDPDRADYGRKDLRQGFAIELRVKFKSLDAERTVLDSRNEEGIGICVRTTMDETLEIVLNDGQTKNCWDTDPDVLEVGRLHHIVINVDGGPKIISFIVDGCLLDGGNFRQFGWGRFSPSLMDVNGDESVHIAPSPEIEVKSFRIYDRYLLTSEVVGNYKAGCSGQTVC